MDSKNCKLFKVFTVSLFINLTITSNSQQGYCYNNVYLSSTFITATATVTATTIYTNTATATTTATPAQNQATPQLLINGSLQVETSKTKWSMHGPNFYACIVVVEAELITIPGCQYAPSLMFHHQTGCMNVTEHTQYAKLAPRTQRTGLPGQCPGSGQKSV